MNCPNCGAAMRLALERESFQCDYCGTVEAPAAGDDGLKATGGACERACPVCHEGLEEVMGAAQILWRCGKCRGLLAPMEGFVALVGAMRAGREESGIVGARPDERDLERRIRCPGCGGTMMTHYYAGPGNVVIDNCPGCRLNWLDHRELRRIVEGSGGEDGDEAWRMPG